MNDKLKLVLRDFDVLLEETPCQKIMAAAAKYYDMKTLQLKPIPDDEEFSPSSIPRLGDIAGCQKRGKK